MNKDNRIIYFNLYFKLMRKVFKIYTINVKLGIIKLWEIIDMIFIFVERGGRLKS